MYKQKQRSLLQIWSFAVLLSPDVWQNGYHKQWSSQWWSNRMQDHMLCREIPLLVNKSERLTDENQGKKPERRERHNTIGLVKNISKGRHDSEHFFETEYYDRDTASDRRRSYPITPTFLVYIHHNTGSCFGNQEEVSNLSTSKDQLNPKSSILMVFILQR